MKFYIAILAVSALSQQAGASKQDAATNQNLRGEVDRRLNPHGCCSWSKQQHYCGSPPGDVYSWCSKDKNTCENKCGGRDKIWLEDCQPLVSKGVCTEKNDHTQVKPCQCGIDADECHGCDGKWWPNGLPTVPPATPTDKCEIQVSISIGPKELSNLSFGRRRRK